MKVRRQRNEISFEMTPLDQLDLSGVRVLDGGMATELEKLGCDLSGALWSARVLREAPEKIAAVHSAYLAAGADCILTASYQVSAEAYADAGLSPKDAEIAAAADLVKSVQIAEDARAGFFPSSRREVLIAASLGPYGAALHNGAEYHGNYEISLDELVAFHARRVAVLAGTSADLIAFETVPSFQEAKAIVKALAPFSEIGGWVTFTCKDESRVAHGEPISECAALLDAAPQVVAVGINCTPPNLVAALLREVRRATDKPIVVYPNSGESWNGATRTWSGTADPAGFGELAAQWVDAGAQIVGGCCRTGPAHVRTIREVLA
ncbi:Homocysteine S-methyltransferase [Acidisarcina polymorpha]|uniref:S-methylmethionine:homocysteine methyltransferase n=1 Tax=Acidisarcina polymorpha TaxID=2211140 RepID=A0A2Z5FX73_9BACT|nr:homocysteine S-methyltransferase [Acidisarcina polymorpha]AXC11320.1 Homocysteine S-methyltransferase [Acidisarcina polymorpha]